jgi:hypothetical protein
LNQGTGFISAPKVNCGFSSQSIGKKVIIYDLLCRDGKRKQKRRRREKVKDRKKKREIISYP